jgi:hypothetical protein
VTVSGTVSATTYEDIAELILPDGEYPRHAVFIGDYCYVISRDGELSIFDVSDIYSLTAFTTKSPVGAPISLNTGLSEAIKGSYMYTAEYSGVVTDISTPSAPIIAGSFTVELPCVNMIVDGDYLICAENGSQGKLEIFDIGTNPVVPERCCV